MSHNGQMRYQRGEAGVANRYYCQTCGGAFTAPYRYENATPCVGEVNGEPLIHGLPATDRRHVAVPGPYQLCPGCNRCRHNCGCDVCLGQAPRYPDVVIPVGSLTDPPLITKVTRRVMTRALISPLEIDVLAAQLTGLDHNDLTTVLHRWVSIT